MLMNKYSIEIQIHNSTVPNGSVPLLSVYFVAFFFAFRMTVSFSVDYVAIEALSSFFGWMCPAPTLNLAIDCPMLSLIQFWAS